MTLYCSLDQAKQIMGTAQQTTQPRTIDDRLVLQNIRIASRRVDQLFRQRRPMFAPWNETRLFSLDGHFVNSYQGTFNFPGNLLALDGTVNINDTNITSLEVYPDSTMPPFHQLRLTADCANWYAQVCDCCTPLQVSIPGIWGFHPDYANAWMAVDALAAAITTTTATTFTVADVDGEDQYGYIPRISSGNLIRIDTEYMEVTKADANSNTVTVIRGVNGSTAATHLISAAVSTWQVDSPVQRAVARQSGLMLARFGAYTVVEVKEFSEVRFPADWLNEVLATMNAYSYE